MIDSINYCKSTIWLREWLYQGLDNFHFFKGAAWNLITKTNQPHISQLFEWSKRIINPTLIINSKYIFIATLFQVMEYSTQTKTMQFQFKHLVLKKLNRAADRRAAELVTEEKFGVYFQCSVR